MRTTEEELPAAVFHNRRPLNTERLTGIKIANCRFTIEFTVVNWTVAIHHLSHISHKKVKKIMLLNQDKKRNSGEGCSRNFTECAEQLRLTIKQNLS
jgi:hypothetical protein